MSQLHIALDLFELSLLFLNAQSVWSLMRGILFYIIYQKRVFKHRKELKIRSGAEYFLTNFQGVW